MLSISEQRKVFKKSCTKRSGENGCQMSKTISREKGQKIIWLLQNDPAVEVLGTQSRDSENAQHNLKIVQIPRLRRTYINLTSDIMKEGFALFLLWTYTSIKVPLAPVPYFFHQTLRLLFFMLFKCGYYLKAGTIQGQCLFHWEADG